MNVQKTSPRILLIGNSARIHAIAEMLRHSQIRPALYVYAQHRNDAFVNISRAFCSGSMHDMGKVYTFAKEWEIDFAIIGPEAALAAGVHETLAKLGIPSIGPSQKLAQIETSKKRARELFEKYNISGNPLYKSFDSMDGVEKYLRELGTFVVKPDGLTGGKGVKVLGDHLEDIDDALNYCQEILFSGDTFVIEDKLEGEEFSLQAFCDGTTLVNMIPVQDHKRAYDDDKGPNTGGMGSYSCENHLLPFLSQKDLADACAINHAVFEALQKECGEAYHGILYGGFILTAKGVRVIEYNARFGDPEVMNILTLLKTDFGHICLAILDGTLHELPIEFHNLASVCKYVVPENYPRETRTPTKPITTKSCAPFPVGHHLFYGAVTGGFMGIYLTNSRSLACVGVGKTLRDAEQRAESVAARLEGPVRHREDIGTQELVDKHVQHMKILKAQ